MPPKASQARKSRSATAAASRRSATAATKKRTAQADGPPAAKRVRVAPTTPAAPLNEPPAPVPPVHVSDIKSGQAARLTMGRQFDTAAPAPAKYAADDPVVARKVFVWGTGEAGQLSLGPPDDDNINKLTKAKPFGNKELSVLTDDGKFGTGGAQLIAAGGMHTLLVDANGRILSCGSDDHGTLGRAHRSAEESEDEGYYVLRELDGISPSGKGISGGEPPQGGEQGPVRLFRATRAVASDGFSAALNSAGELLCWGHFKDGEGKVCFSDTDEHGAPREQWWPVPIPALQHERFAQVACGENHVLALTLDGRVYSWGLNSVSQLGRFANQYHVRQRFSRRDPPASMHLTPATIPELRNIVRIASGLNTSFAVDRDGHVFAWGLNTRGQTGTGLKKDRLTRPTRVRALDPAHHGGAHVLQIAGGEFHTVFLLSNGHILVCGDGDEGKLGLPASHPALQGKGTPPVLLSPVQVPVPAPPEWAPASAKAADGGTAIVGIAAGMRFSFALAADGTLYSWGTTSDEAMGQPAEEWGADQSKATPTAVAMPGAPGAWTVVSVATAGQHSLALAVRAP